MAGDTSDGARRTEYASARSYMKIAYAALSEGSGMKRRMASRGFIILEVHMEEITALQPTGEAIFCTPFAGSRPNKRRPIWMGRTTTPAFPEGHGPEEAT